MKPLNLDNRPCSPISSNCVIWQGPDIPCIKLCTGDTVSDIVFKLATELCTIMDTLDIKNYDLSCFDLAVCPPDTFQELIQFLIEQICASQGFTPTTDGTRSTCPDCVITVAPCFVVNGQTTMQLVDYVQMIADRLCEIIDAIADINNQITNIDNRVTVLENTPPPTFTLPSIAVDCTLAEGSIVGGNSYPIDQILNALINDDIHGYCALLGATGLPEDLISAVQSQCIDGSSDSLAFPGQQMDTAYSPFWVDSPITAADAITNLWITLCDARTAITENGTTVVEGGDGVIVTSATVGTVTTYTVTNDYLETFVANLTIRNTYAPDSGVIPKVTPSSVNGVQEGQVISKYTSIGVNKNFVTATLGSGNYVTNGCIPTISFGTFDNDNGLFTITDPGTYLLNGRVHLKPDNGSTVFWSGTVSTDIGSFVLGIHPNNNTDTFVAQGQALIPSIDRNVELSVSQVLVATAGTTLRLKVLNTTDRDYDGTGYAGADGISFSIVKLKDGLITTVCP